MITVAEIIKYQQPEVFNLLNRVYIFETIHINLDEDEDYEFQQIKELMEKPRGVQL